MLPILIARHTCKPVQQSYDIWNIGSNTISVIPKTANDALILSLSNTINNALKWFNTRIVCMQVYNKNKYISLRSYLYSDIDPKIYPFQSDLGSKNHYDYSETFQIKVVAQ